MSKGRGFFIFLPLVTFITSQQQQQQNGGLILTPLDESLLGVQEPPSMQTAAPPQFNASDEGDKKRRVLHQILGGTVPNESVFTPPMLQSLGGGTAPENTTGTGNGPTPTLNNSTSVPGP